MSTRDDLHDGGDADQVRRRAPSTRRAGSSSASASPRAFLVTDPGVVGRRPRRARAARRSRPRASRSSSTTRPRVEPTLESLEHAVRRRARGRAPTASSRSAAARRSTPRRSPTSSLTPPGAGDGVRQRAGRRGPQAAVAADAAPGDPDDVGHRQRGDDGRGARPPRAEGQERHLAPLPAPGPGDRRPRADAHAARPRSSRRRASTSSATPPSRTSRIPFDSRPRPESPGDRPPYQGSNPVADVWSAKALEYGGRFLRRAVADADDVEARGAMMLAASLAGVGLRLGRRAHPPRLRLSDRRPQARVPAARLPGRPPVRPARALGHRHRAGGVPLHLRGRARAPRPRRVAARPASR